MCAFPLLNFEEFYYNSWFSIGIIQVIYPAKFCHMCGGGSSVVLSDLWWWIAFIKVHSALLLDWTWLGLFPIDLLAGHDGCLLRSLVRMTVCFWLKYCCTQNHGKVTCTCCVIGNCWPDCLPGCWLSRHTTLVEI